VNMYPDSHRVTNFLCSLHLPFILLSDRRVYNRHVPSKDLIRFPLPL
jgi:hypothetical protein